MKIFSYFSFYVTSWLFLSPNVLAAGSDIHRGVGTPSLNDSTKLLAVFNGKYLGLLETWAQNYNVNGAFYSSSRSEERFDGQGGCIKNDIQTSVPCYNTVGKIKEVSKLPCITGDSKWGSLFGTYFVGPCSSENGATLHFEWAYSEDLSRGQIVYSIVHKDAEGKIFGRDSIKINLDGRDTVLKSSYWHKRENTETTANKKLLLTKQQ